MKSVVLGTAGHVDHGKTALVEALTGVNTDRWQEERERGITIDLGFAPFPSDSPNLEISVVDVPGHEDFVKNMLAGATGLDLLLLVVAADEGSMPQTHEHLWIARLLGVERGVVAVTKADLVDAEWCALVRESVREELHKIFDRADWPIVTVSAVSGDGLGDLRTAIVRAAHEAPARRDDDLFRLPVDRSFSVRGVGTVVTGTVWSGRLESGSEVRILPGDRRARVRGIQVHGRDVTGTRAGQRAALALAGVDRSEVARGDQLAVGAVWRGTRYLDARLRLIPDSPWPLKHWQRVRFHLGTAEALARVVLYGRQRLEPGESDLVQFRLERELVARAGDRFVVRFYSPVTTVAGGIVLDPWAQRRARLVAGAAERLAAMAELGLPGRVQAALGAGEGASPDELAIRTGAPLSDVTAALEALAAEGVVRRINNRWFDVADLHWVRATLLDSLKHGHARDSGARGVSLESLRSAVRRPAELVNAVLADLEREGAVRVEGAVAALSEHRPALPAEQQELAVAALARIRDGGRTPPSVRELAAALGARPDRLLPVLKFLRERGELITVTADLYYSSGAMNEIRERVKDVLGGGHVASPSELRQALGVSRKYLIPLLEYFDGVGLTRRTGEGRALRERD